MEQAACKDMAPRKRGEPDIFFPEKGQAVQINEAVVVCFGCKVRSKCKEYRKQTGSDSGVWGGEYIGRGD